MTTHGIINCWVDGRGIDPPVQIYTSTTTGIYAGSTIFQLTTSFFVTLYRFLNSSEAQSLGIIRRSYNVGVAAANYDGALGMDYWDGSLPIGNHAWAAFEFTNASPKFWLLIQLGFPETVSGDTYVDQNAFGISSGYPGKLLLPWISTNTNTSQITEATKHSGVGIAIATDINDISPWNGTTNNDGTDTKGVPVWTSSSAVWPRTNNDQAVSGSLKEHMFGLYYDMACWKTIGLYSTVGTQQITVDTTTYNTHDQLIYDNHDTIYHIIADENHITVFVDTMNINNSTFFYFGDYKKYPNVQLSSSIPPYVCLYKNLMFNDNTGILTLNSNQVYGSRDYGWNTVAREDQPNATSSLHHGGVLDPATGKVVGLSLFCNTIMTGSSFFESSFNTVRPNDTKKIQLHNTIVCINEFPGRRAPIGEIEYFKLASNIRPATTLSNRSMAVFGTPHFSFHKIVVPWHTGSYPGINVTRSGTMF